MYHHQILDEFQLAIYLLFEVYPSQEAMDRLQMVELMSFVPILMSSLKVEKEVILNLLVKIDLKLHQDKKLTS